LMYKLRKFTDTMISSNDTNTGTKNGASQKAVHEDLDLLK